MGAILAIFVILSVIFLALFLRSERKREDQMIDYAYDENYFRDEISELENDVDRRNKVIQDQSAELAAERRKVSDLQNHVASLRKLTDVAMVKPTSSDKATSVKKTSTKKKSSKPVKKK